MSERMGKIKGLTAVFKARWRKKVLAQSLNTEIVRVSSLYLKQLFASYLFKACSCDSILCIKIRKNTNKLKILFRLYSAILFKMTLYPTKVYEKVRWNYILLSGNKNMIEHWNGLLRIIHCLQIIQNNICFVHFFRTIVGEFLRQKPNTKPKSPLCVCEFVCASWFVLQGCIYQVLHCWGTAWAVISIRCQNKIFTGNPGNV